MKPFSIFMMVGILTLLLTLAPGHDADASGEESTVALLQSDVHPDLPFARFAAGELGIVQPKWRMTFLYVAYRYLAGPPLSADEQRSVSAYWDVGLGIGLSAPESQLAQDSPWIDANVAIASKEALAAWIAAHNQIPGVKALDADAMDLYRSSPIEILYYANCNGSAFQTATQTLAAMVAKFGVASAQVKQWVDAQDLVFDNCSVTATSGPDAPHGSIYVPPPLSGGTAFEQEQRAYQIAAAYFYGGYFETAMAHFDAIAHDPASPWRELAPYLVARAMIRKATLASASNDQAELVLAEAQLKEVSATSDDASVKQSAQRLLGFVEAQLNPIKTEQELGNALMQETSGAQLVRGLFDYQWLRNKREPYSESAAAINSASDLADWLFTFSELADENGLTDELIAHAVKKWKERRSLPWLAAALMGIKPADPDASALLKAAETVAADSPAYPTVAYQSARLMLAQGHREQARTKLDGLLTQRSTLPLSTVNQVLALRMKTARNLDELLADAPRTPLGFSSDHDQDELPMKPSDLVSAEYELPSGPVLDDDGAAVFTRWLPLEVLVMAVRSPILPPPLRNQVARAALVRALLLENRAAVAELAPAVAGSSPTLQRWIDAWLDAATPEARSFAAAYLLLQYPGLSFAIEPGAGRITPLDQIDSMRDNWWSIGNFGFAAKQPNYPSFLTAAQRKSADDEWSRLSALNAPAFMCNAAIQRARAAEDDWRLPNALYRCTVAVHYGCSNQQDTALAHSAFLLLHHLYPESPAAEASQY